MGAPWLWNMSPTKSLSVSIGLDAKRAYDFLSLPENFPKWASGLAGSLKKVGGEWQAQTPEGPMKVRFSERPGLRTMLVKSIRVRHLPQCGHSIGNSNTSVSERGM